MASLLYFLGNRFWNFSVGNAWTARGKFRLPHVHTPRPCHRRPLQPTLLQGNQELCLCTIFRTYRKCICTIVLERSSCRWSQQVMTTVRCTFGTLQQLQRKCSLWLSMLLSMERRSVWKSLQCVSMLPLGNCSPQVSFHKKSPKRIARKGREKLKNDNLSVYKIKMYTRPMRDSNPRPSDSINPYVLA